jgi:DNA-binding GntR family transcriptional regulator
MPAEIVALPTATSQRAAKAHVVAYVRELIRTGAAPLGGRLSDKRISSELGLSRTPVREALLQLQAEGLVVMRPQSGTFVVDLSVDDLRQVCSLREILETGALRIAAQSTSSQEIAELGMLVGRASIALGDGDLALCDLLDCEFHEALISASCNAYLIKSYRCIADQLRALRHRMPRDPQRMAAAIMQHRHVVDLWAAGRVEKSINELGLHVRNVERLLLAVEAPEPVSSMEPQHY